MYNYVIERKELRGNAASNLGNIRTERLTCGDIGSLLTKVTSQIQANVDFNISRYEILEDKLMPTIDKDSSMYIDNYEFEIKVLLLDPFEVKLWAQVDDLLTKGKKQKALFTLFERLNDQLDNPHDCNNFILHVMKYDLSSDIIVHVLNALSPIKNKLQAWEKFVSFSTLELNNKVGEDKAKRLLKVIV